MPSCTNIHLRWHGDFMIDCLVDRQTAHVYSELKQCREALRLEKNAHKVYSMYLGENHETTKSCHNSVVVRAFISTLHLLSSHPLSLLTVNFTMPRRL